MSELKLNLLKKFTDCGKPEFYKTRDHEWPGKPTRYMLTVTQDEVDLMIVLLNHDLIGQEIRKEIERTLCACRKCRSGNPDECIKVGYNG